MSLNDKIIPLETPDYAAGGKRSIELDKGRTTLRLDCHLTATLRVDDASPAGDGSVSDDPIHRIIRRIRIMAGRFELWNSDLRDAYRYHLHNVSRVQSLSEPEDTDLDAQGNIDVEMFFSLHFARGYLVNPIETALPDLGLGDKPLKLEIEWEDDAPNANSDAGTGAIVSSGSDTYLWNSEPDLEVNQIIVPRTGPQFKPFGVPVFEGFTKEYDAALSRFKLTFDNDRRFDFLLLRTGHGSDEVAEDTINKLSIEATGESFIDDVDREILTNREVELFTALDGSPETGYIGLRMAGGGRLSNVVNPLDHQDLKILADISAPGSSPGVFEVMQGQLVGWPGGRTRLPAARGG